MVKRIEKSNCDVLLDDKYEAIDLLEDFLNEVCFLFGLDTIETEIE
jgi:hypothetical protein